MEQEPPKYAVEYISPIPFPQRLVGKGDANNFNQFLETLKKIPKSIHVLDMIEQVPQYLKFLREVTMHKRRLKEHTRVHLTEECNAILQHQLPSKLKDPGSFTIPCSIGSHFIDKCLCDLGASVNLMPVSLFRKLGLGELKPTTTSLQLADRSIIHPMGVLEDILVKVGKFYLPADFLVLDLEEDMDIPVILGRPFLATSRAMIDVNMGKITIRVGGNKEEFHVLTNVEHPQCESKDATYEMDTGQVLKPTSMCKNTTTMDVNRRDDKLVVDVKGDDDKVLKDAACFMLDPGQSLTSKKMNKKAAKAFAKLSKSFQWFIKGRNEESNHLDPQPQTFLSYSKKHVMNVIKNVGGSSCLNFEPP